MCCTMEKIAWYTLNLQRIAAVAQSVERLACMHIVRCSSPNYDRPKLLNEVLTVPILNDWQDYYLALLCNKFEMLYRSCFVLNFTKPFT